MYGRQPFHIAAYTFKADTRCCDCVAKWASKKLMKKGYTENDVEIVVRDMGPNYDVGVYAYRSESLLEELAIIKKINLEDPYSYDSDDFPKLIFSDQIENKERCGKCGKVIK